MSRLQSRSLRYVRVAVTAIVNGVSKDPTGDPVNFSLITRPSEPTNTTTWTPGTWETGQTGPPFWARILVGPAGTLNPGVGTYGVWVQIVDNPEIPVLDGGDLYIY